MLGTHGGGRGRRWQGKTNNLIIVLDFPDFLIQIDSVVATAPSIKFCGKVQPPLVERWGLNLHLAHKVSALKDWTKIFCQIPGERECTPKLLNPFIQNAILSSE